MSKIEQLIQQLCPEGVEYKRLGEVCEIKRGERITKRDILKEGEFPVISGGIYPLGRYNKFNREANTITIASYGSAGYVNYQRERFWANDVCLCLYPSTSIGKKFLYYYLCSMQSYLFSKTTKAIPDHIPTEVISNLSIPLPPLPVQQEIVRILDAFTQLEAELEARKKQYEYYRDRLLTFKVKN